MTTVITIALLQRSGMCLDQVSLFRNTFGSKCILNKTNYIKAIHAGLHIGYFLQFVDQTLKYYKEIHDLRETVRIQSKRLPIESTQVNSIYSLDDFDLGKLEPHEWKWIDDLAELWWPAYEGLAKLAIESAKS